MSTAKPGPTGQEQPRAPAAPSNHHLDTLQSMFNLILIQSGRFIKEHQAGGGTGRQKLGLQRAVPAATERFHDALDELENEVRLAQTVLRRDLAVLKQDRKEREAAAKEQEVEKARLAAEARNPPPTQEPLVKQETEVATPQPTVPVPDGPPPKVDEPAEELKREEESATALPVKESTPLPDPLFDGTPTTANPQDEFDFDAIFDEPMDTAGENNQDDMMDTSGDMNFSLDDSPSLLRGLEDFAKSSDGDNAAQNTIMDLDLPMPDFPELHTSTDVQREPLPVLEPIPARVPASTTKVEEKPAAKESKPEAPVEKDEMMATTGADDLEDLFNLDEYENPEQSSFDDAFFDFGS